MRTKFNNLTLALIVTSSALLAACGGGGDGGSTSYSSGSSSSSVSASRTGTSYASSSSTTTSLATSAVKSTTFSRVTSGQSSADVTLASVNSVTTTSSASTSSHYNNTTLQNQANEGFKKVLGSDNLSPLLNFVDSTSSYLTKTPSGARSMYLFDGINRLVLGKQGNISVGSKTISISIPYTISSRTSFLSAPRWYGSTTGASVFTGSGVKVSIVDGYLNPNDAAFSSTPTKLEITSESSYTSGDDLGKDEEHGTKVAKIIIGKRLDSSNYGIAPKSTLSYLTLKQTVSDSTYYKLVYDKAAEAGSIINSSINIPTPDDNAMTVSNGVLSFNNNVTTASAEQGRTAKTAADIKKATALAGIVESLKVKTATESTSPLYVFATGNLDALTFKDGIKTTTSVSNTNSSADTKKSASDVLADLYYNALKNSSSSSLSSTDNKSTATSATLGFDKSKLYSSDFGFQLRDTDSLGLLVQDNKISDNIIIVTGVDTEKDSTTQVTARQTALTKAREALKTQTSNGNNSSTAYETDSSKAVTKATNVALKNEYNPKDTTSTSETSEVTFYNSYLKGINTHYAAIQCGVTKYSCISAIFTVNGSSGTSFAAPQVTAVAALVKQQFPWMTSKQIKTTILTTATDLGEEGVDEVYGWGLVNAAKAVTGPNGFVFGDFEADLSLNGSSNKSYFFNNNIYGQGGLKVSGGTSDYLYLLGSNTYTGKTVVDSGNLVVTPGSTFGTNIVGTASLASDLYVNHEGKAYLVTASTKSVTNNGLLYLSNANINGSLTNKENATIAFDATTASKVSGSVDLKGNALIVTQGKYTLNGNFSFNVLGISNSSVNNSNVSFSSVTFSDSATVKGAATVIGSGTSKALQISVSSSKVNELSLASTKLDSTNLASGAADLDAVLDTAEQEVTVARSLTLSSTAVTTSEDTASNKVANTESNSNLVRGNEVSVASANSGNVADTENVSPVVTPTTKAQELAAAIQALDKSALAATTYASSAPVFTDIQQASRQSFASESNAFSQQVGLVQLLERPNSDEYYAYSNFGLGSEKLTADSVVKGNLNQRNLTVGVYTYIGNQGYGVAVQTGTASFNNYYKNSWLSQAKTNLYGVTFNFNQLVSDRLNFAASLGVAQSKHKVTRATLLSNNLTSEFKQTQVDLNLGLNYRLWSNDKASLVVSPALELSSSRQQAFAEVSSDAYGNILAKQALAKTTQNVFAHLGFAYLHKFSLAGLDSVLDLQLKAQQALTDNKFNLNFANGSTSGQVFGPKFLVNLTSGLSVQVTDSLRVRLAGSYQKSTNWKNREANLNFVVKF